MYGPGQPGGFVVEVQSELVVAMAVIVDVENALFEIDGAGFRAGTAQSQLQEAYLGLGHEAQRAAVFELYFGASIVAGPEMSPFGDGRVEKSFFPALSGVAVDLNVAFHAAQTHDTSLRIGECRNCHQR